MYIIYPGNARAYFVASNKYSLIRKRKRGRRITIFKTSFLFLWGLGLLFSCTVVVNLMFGYWFKFFVFWLLFSGGVFLVTVSLVFAVSEII